MSLGLADVPWECPICFEQQVGRGWCCPAQHRFCAECMRHHVNAVAFPRCPQVDCGYDLCERDLASLNVDSQRIVAFQSAKLQCAVDTCAFQGEVLVRCPNEACTNAFVQQGKQRRRYACPCGTQPFCTACLQPYHFHAPCGRVQPLREHWLAWISGGREDYQGRARIATESDRRNGPIRDAMARHSELEFDEQWKAENCRLCPACSRPVSKIAGCDSMVCGQSAHGGDQQPGCGHRFNFASAERYAARVERLELPAMSTEQLRLRGRSAFHAFTACSICKSSSSGGSIRGPRFRCIHCEAFDVCIECEPALAYHHDPSHVFEIMFESDVRWVQLPTGTRVRIVRCGDELPRCLTSRGAYQQLEGLYGTVSGLRRPPLQSYLVELEDVAVRGVVALCIEHLEPVLASQDEAQELLARSVPGMDVEEVATLAVQFPETPHREVALRTSARAMSKHVDEHGRTCRCDECQGHRLALLEPLHCGRAAPEEAPTKSWREYAGRGSGADGYEFGDLTRGLIGMVWRR